jgi:hypothetical protein
MNEKVVSRDARTTELRQGGNRSPVPPLPLSSQWLRSMLIDKGILSEAGLSRNAGIRTCRTCRQHCLAGIAITGLDTWLDTHQLHSDGELHALLDGRPTFSLYAGKQLVPRDRHWIRCYPAGHAKRPTFAAHRCDQPIPTDWIHKETP